LGVLIVGTSVLTIAASPCQAGWLSEVVKGNIDLAKQVAAVHVQPQTVQVPAPVVAPPPTPIIAVVTEPERAKLLQSIDELNTSAAQNASRNGNVALALVIAAIVLGVAASIAGFCKAATVAGVLSILTTATVGANNALPFREDANSYKIVAAQSHALGLDVTLHSSITQDEFKGYAQKLTALAAYGDDKAVSGSTQQLQELLEKLRSTDLAAEQSH
jgi:hypothetical protein